ncbi:uncharacterized protein BHQ10_001013 [Talaromyces amestolkiae]|uniref:Condensation domain-containing protein n=1 Tax=Talaromyces amestolkiae TaxID=1196081 RepID=A0A364KNB1_TALAM|nr:uncharacterized protein BHQ10_001013 [Talaromyces amestolkiae]RAO65001.1 hypothetical protein BHQ10_001013 [Talaromyces amestolkiae]
MESTTYTVRAEVSFEGVYPLSPSDLLIPPRAIRQAFIYRNDNQVETKEHTLIAALQESLKTFLKPLDKDKEPTETAYPQLLGRVVRPKDGSPPHVAVDESSSIPFTVVRRPDIIFADLSPAQRFPEERIQKTNFAIGLDDSDLLSKHNFAVQLTFIEGGYVLVVQIHHAITDGYGYAGFVRQWLQMTKALIADGLYEEAVPQMSIHDKSELLRDIDESPTAVEELNGLKTWEALYKEASTTAKANKNPLMGNNGIQSKIFWLSPESLESLRAKMHSHTEDRPTIFESVMAHAWQCLARARADSNTVVETTISNGFFAADIRNRLVPRLATDYFGNAVTPVVARVPLSTLLLQQHRDIIKPIQSTLRTDTTDRNLRAINALIFRQTKAGIFPPGNLLEQDVFFNSWEHLYPSLEAMEIGVGKFCIMRNLMDSPITPSYVLVMPSYGMRQTSSSDGASYRYPGGIELKVHLLQHQMERLVEDDEWLHYVSI